jgi:hypothetical protein
VSQTAVTERNDTNLILFITHLLIVYSI